MFIFIPNMKTTNNISFKSRINILSSTRFDKLPISKNTIHFFQDAKHNNIVLAPDFQTYQIRTCTGGGLTSKANPLAIGFHFWDELKYKDLKNYIKYIKKLMPTADSGILIGSKKVFDSDNSIPYFNELQQKLSEICPNISYFKTFMQPYGQANFNYFKNTDTWNINLNILKPYTEEFASIYTLKKLLTFFKEISIAPTDTLFVNGKQITKKQAPQIFR